MSSDNDKYLKMLENLEIFENILHRSLYVLPFRWTRIDNIKDKKISFMWLNVKYVSRLYVK